MQVTCTAMGSPSTTTMAVSAQAIPQCLEWGQVLISMRAAPISPADVYTASTGGVFGSDSVTIPYEAGHDGVGVVFKVQ